MRVIRYSSFKRVPWKNGGGITFEAMRVPEAGDPFLWRVSVAHVNRAGPFSAFPDHHRFMVLLRGAGVRLTVDAVPDIWLRAVGDLAEFDGASPTACDLLGGPCLDLNLMVSKSLAVAQVRVLALKEPQALLPSNRLTQLAFVIGGAVDVRGDGDLEQEPTLRLAEWDLVVAREGDRRSLCPGVPAYSGASAHPLVFLAALDDNSR